MGAYVDDAWGAWRKDRVIHPDFEAITEVGFRGGFGLGYDKALEQPRRAGEYIMARFPDLEWHECSDIITALCDRLEHAEGEVKLLTTGPFRELEW